MRVRKRTLLPSLALALALVAGCGSSTDDASSPPRLIAGPGLEDLISVIGPHLDFEVPVSSTELSEVHDIAIEGRIATVQDGRVQLADLGNGVRSVVFGIEVTETFKEDPNRRGRLVFFELTRADNVAVSEYSGRMPPGTRVIFLGYRAASMQPVVSEFAGRESGSSLYQPSAQGLFVVNASPNGADSTRASTLDTSSWSELTPVMSGAGALPPDWRDLSAQEIRGDLREW